MCHPELEKLLETANAVGLRVAILTNGIGITQNKANAIVRYAELLRISRDDAPTGQEKNVRIVLMPTSPVDYQAQRIPLPLNTPMRPIEDSSEGIEKVDKRPRDYNAEIEQSLNNLKEARKRYPAGKCRTGMAFTIQKVNIGAIREMAEYASQKQIVVMFKLAHDPGNFNCSEVALAEFQEEVLNNKEITENPHVSINYLRDQFFRKLKIADIAAGLPTRSYYRENETICFTPYLYSLIDFFGGVYVCSHLYDDNGKFKSDVRDKFKIGDISDAPFLEVWRSTNYEAMRKLLKPINTCQTTTCERCTRHWTPNSILTQLYREVFLPLKEAFGLEDAMTEYSRMVTRYAAEDSATWF